ncbi:hypothetical protein NA32_10010, partial [Streptococcus hongkongensis]
MRRQQSLATWLDITATCPDGAIFEFTGGFIQADAAFVAGVVFIVGTVFGRERDFIRVAAGAGFSQLDGGKGADVQAEHVPGIARGKIQAQVGRRMRQVGGVFIVIVTGRIEIFTVTLTLPVIYAAGHRESSINLRLSPQGHGKPCSNSAPRLRAPAFTLTH